MVRKIGILFVCHGNICRSPMAEFVMKDLINKRGFSDIFQIESRATSTEEIGNGIHPPVQRELRRREIPFSSRRAKQMESSDYGSFDYIVAMDNQNLSNMRRFVGGDPERKVSLMLEHIGETRGVADPWYTGDCASTYEDIAKACAALLEKIVSENGLRQT